MDNVFRVDTDYIMLDLIWNNTTDAIFTIGYDGSIISANPAFEDMLGWRVEDLKGFAYPPYLFDISREEHQKLLHQLREGKDFPYTVMKRKDKEGKILDMLASYRAINDKKILAVGMYKDFTEQMLIQQKLKESEYCYRMLVEHLPEVIIKQRYGKIDFINASGLRLFGTKQLEDIIGYSIWDFVLSKKRDEIQHRIDLVYDQNDDTPQTMVVQLVRYDGIEIVAEMKIIPIGSKEEPDIQIVISDVTEKKKYESQLEFLAYHDPLTGLKNRRIFTEIVTDSLEKAKAAKEEIAILYIDIDKFKDINDTFGHDVGDKLLQEFAERLKSSVREKDVLCRIGGDEFLVLLKGIKDKKQIDNITKRMYDAFQDPYKINGTTFNVTSSIGISVFPRDGIKIRTLIYHADQALYRAKKERNRYLFYNN